MTDGDTLVVRFGASWTTELYTAQYLSLLQGHLLSVHIAITPRALCAPCDKGGGQVLRGVCTRGFTAAPVGLHGAQGAVSGQLLGRL